MFAKTDEYLAAHAPAPPTADPPTKDAPASSLAPTQFEQLFGRETGLLLDVVDDDTDKYGPEEKELAFRLMVGDNDFSMLGAHERELLDQITHKISQPAPNKQQLEVGVVRPSHISTQAEMENFDQEYQPPPAQQDWPVVGLPEGDQS
jgi:hypothetical protein